MNSTKLPIIYTADVAEGEREDFPEAMIFAWNQNNEQGKESCVSDLFQEKWVKEKGK